MKSGIYKIINLINNKVYIGQARNLNTRYREHLYRIKKEIHHNIYLQKSFEKYGKENFKYDILEEIEDISLFNLREKYWIDYYGGINSDNTYNLKDPMSNDYSNYVRKKISKSNSGKNNPNYGSYWDDDQKENLSKNRKGFSWDDLYGIKKANKMRKNQSKSQKGRKASQETKEKLRKLNTGNKNPAYGKGDRQKGEKNPMYGKPSSIRKPVLKFDKEGNFIKRYEFLQEVFKDGFNIGNVSSAASGKLKSSGGFTWKYEGV